MTEQSQRQIEEEIIKLPKDNQEAINAVDWIKLAEEIGKKLSLTDEEINKFQVITGVALVGLINQNRYAFEIEKIGLTAKEAQNIILEVTEKIMAPIAKKIENSIKKNILLKNPKWEQSVNFIVSGGDYSVFLDK